MRLIIAPDLHLFIVDKLSQTLLFESAFVFLFFFNQTSRTVIYINEELQVTVGNPITIKPYQQCGKKKNQE